MIVSLQQTIEVHDQWLQLYHTTLGEGQKFKTIDFNFSSLYIII